MASEIAMVRKPCLKEFIKVSCASSGSAPNVHEEMGSKTRPSFPIVVGKGASSVSEMSSVGPAKSECRFS